MHKLSNDLVDLVLFVFQVRKEDELRRKIILDRFNFEYNILTSLYCVNPVNFLL
jgi:hypothetical protein